MRKIGSHQYGPRGLINFGRWSLKPHTLKLGRNNSGFEVISKQYQKR